MRILPCNLSQSVLQWNQYLQWELDALIRLIATDLDGTLLSGRSNLPQRNIEALRRAMAAGVYVVICTGRMLEAAMPMAERIGVNAPMVLFNGAMTYDRAAERVISKTVIPRARAIEVLRAIEDAGAYVQAFPGRGYFYEKKCALTEYYSDKIGVTGTEVGGRLSDWLNSDVCKLLALGTLAEMNALQKKLAPQFPDIDFVKSGETHLEVIAKNVDKAAGLAQVCAHLGVQSDEVMAFGDEQNDASMLHYAGAGYIMENAAPELKAQFRFIAPANTACGVADIVNLYLDEHRMGG